MRRIWKFPLSSPVTTMRAPVGQVVLVGYKEPDIFACVWIEHDEEAESIDRTFRIVGTGWPIPGDSIHVGSYITGSYVWHLYEVFA